MRATCARGEAQHHARGTMCALGAGKRRGGHSADPSRSTPKNKNTLLLAMYGVRMMCFASPCISALLICFGAEFGDVMLMVHGHDCCILRVDVVTRFRSHWCEFMSDVTRNEHMMMKRSGLPRGLGSCALAPVSRPGSRGGDASHAPSGEFRFRCGDRARLAPTATGYSLCYHLSLIAALTFQ